jgi:hypothetical protein
VFETLGVAGIVISVLAYVPQVVHLGRQHCSAGTVASQERCKRLRTQAPAGYYAAAVTVSATTSSLPL